MDRHRPDKFELEVGYLISKTALYFKISALQYFKQNNYGITPEQFGILYILFQENGLYQRQLSKLTLKDRPNVTRLLDILTERELVYREADPNNRRIHKVFITEKGRKEIEKILPCIIEMHNKTIHGLNKDDLDALKRILGKIRNNLGETFKLQT